VELVIVSGGYGKGGVRDCEQRRRLCLVMGPCCLAKHGWRPDSVNKRPLISGGLTRIPRHVHAPPTCTVAKHENRVHLTLQKHPQLH
jgi:hypothetical protein